MSSSNKYSGSIGYIPIGELAGKTFHQNVTIEQAIALAKEGSMCGNPNGVPCSYFGFKLNPGSSTLGTAWIPKKVNGKYEYTPKPKSTGTGLLGSSSNIPLAAQMPMYLTPMTEVDCKDNRDCLVDAKKNELEKHKQKLINSIDKHKEQMEQIDVKKIEVSEGISYEEALKKYKMRKAKDEANRRSKEYKKQLSSTQATLVKLQSAKNKFNKLNFGMGIGDEQLNHDIEQTKDRISQLNSKLNRVREVINTNNSRFSLKNNVVKTLGIVFGIIIVIFIGMIVYYSGKAGKLQIPSIKQMVTLAKPISKPASTVTMGAPTPTNSFRIP